MNPIATDDRLEHLVTELVHAYPFYRKWANENMKFQDLPIIDKSIVNEHRESLQLSSEAALIESFTSGSTGVPFRCVKTPEEKMELSMAIHRHRRKWGLPLRHESVIIGSSLYANQRMVAQYASQIANTHPHMIQGRCSAIYRIAEYFAAQHVAIPKNLLFIQNWGEIIQPAQKKRIEEIFQVPVLNYYGLEEVWLIAFSNDAGFLEVDDQVAHVEVIDPKTSMPVAEGEIGDILVTSFVMKSIPFVRYRTGDVGRVYVDPVSGKKILDLLPFRANQIKLADRTVDASIFRYLDQFYHQLSIEQGVKQFQLIQESFTSFRLLIVANRRNDAGLAMAADQLELLLRQCLFSEDVTIAIDCVDEIPPHPVSGKFHPFVCQVS
ncbi:hypothetical protein [Paenibacillus sp. SI8]|uniref:hypothetical protein n=1 Tax=unclassified Paenibacillus TaxID=185978 RepID=UPI00346665BA